MNENELLAHLMGTTIEEALVWTHNQTSPPTTNPPGFDDELRYEVKGKLLEHGLISSEISPQSEWTLTPLGRRLAVALEASKATGPRRRAAVQKAIMRHIYDDQPVAVENFGERIVDGMAVGERDVEDALRSLKEWGLINGVGTAGGVLVRPELTPFGMEALDDPKNPADFVRNGGTIINDHRNHVQNSGTMGVTAVGHHARQVGNTISINAASEIAAVLGELKERLAARGEELPPSAASAADQMEVEASKDNPDPLKLSSLFATFVGAVAVKLADPTYEGVSSLVGQLGTLISGT